MEILEEIKRLKQRGALVIVEGPKDRQALERLGIMNVLTLSRKPVFAVVEEAAEAGEVVILTDFDAKGEELYGRLASDLRRHGVKVDNRLRNLLLKSRLSHVEGLVSFLRENV